MWPWESHNCYLLACHNIFLSHFALCNMYHWNSVVKYPKTYLLVPFLWRPLAFICLFWKKDIDPATSFTFWDLRFSQWSKLTLYGHCYVDIVASATLQGVCCDADIPLFLSSWLNLYLISLACGLLLAESFKYTRWQLLKNVTGGSLWLEK